MGWRPISEEERRGEERIHNRLGLTAFLILIVGAAVIACLAPA